MYKENLYLFTRRHIEKYAFNFPFLQSIILFLCLKYYLIKTNIDVYYIYLIIVIFNLLFLISKIILSAKYLNLYLELKVPLIVLMSRFFLFLIGFIFIIFSLFIKEKITSDYSCGAFCLNSHDIFIFILYLMVQSGVFFICASSTTFLGIRNRDE